MKPTSRRSRTTSSPDCHSLSTAPLTTSTVARSISPRGATTSVFPWRRVATSKLPESATNPSSSLHLSRARRDETGGYCRRFFALQVNRGIHAPHAVSRQTPAERVERPSEPLSVLQGQVAADD